MDSEIRRRTNVKIDLSRKKGGVIKSPLIVKKSTVTPLPFSLCLLLYSLQIKHWHLRFDWHTEHIGAMNELSPCIDVYNTHYRVLLAESHFVDRMNGWHRFSIICRHRNNLIKGWILCSVFQFYFTSIDILPAQSIVTYSLETYLYYCM